MGSSCTTQDRCLQVFGGLALATFKLHLAAFHLPDQVRACGASFFMLEYWVERLVQLYKRMVKYRSTAFPELIFINSYLLHQACMNWLHRYGVKALVTMEEAVDRAREERRTRKRAKTRGGRLIPAGGSAAANGCGTFGGAALTRRCG